jgi:hypothetical protein
VLNWIGQVLQQLALALALVVIGGPSTSALVIPWGSTLALFGLAARSEGYSNALGWTGVIFGAAVFVLGTIQFVKPNVIFPGVILYGIRHRGHITLDARPGCRCLATNHWCRSEASVGSASVRAAVSKGLSTRRQGESIDPSDRQWRRRWVQSLAVVTVCDSAVRAMTMTGLHLLQPDRDPMPCC